LKRFEKTPFILYNAINGKQFEIFRSSFFLFNIIIYSQKYPFRNFLEKDGLPSPIVRSILQDSEGFIWIGTTNGLSRFDGIEFKNLKKDKGPQENVINSLLEDREGNIWVGGRKGLNCFSADKKTDKKK